MILNHSVLFYTKWEGLVLEIGPTSSYVFRLVLKSNITIQYAKVYVIWTTKNISRMTIREHPPPPPQMYSALWNRNTVLGYFKSKKLMPYDCSQALFCSGNPNDSNLLTCKVSRYSRLTLHGTIVKANDRRVVDATRPLTMLTEARMNISHCIIMRWPGCIVGVACMVIDSCVVMHCYEGAGAIIFVGWVVSWCIFNHNNFEIFEQTERSTH